VSLDKGRDGRHLMATGVRLSGAFNHNYVTEYGTSLASVKGMEGAKLGPIAERLAILLDVFSPWDGISLTYRQFAAEIGAPITEAAIKKWPQRKKFPADVARLIVTKARDRGLVGVTLEWVLWGDGIGPQKAPATTPNSSVGQRSPRADAPRGGLGRSTTPQEHHGQFAAQVGDALRADLSHNEFGQWSSDEVQHTVIWALKDLARRLRALRFDMGKTFELTDEWAGMIGLPVRPPERRFEQGDPEEA
jgi:hypothetical protein